MRKQLSLLVALIFCTSILTAQQPAPVQASHPDNPALQIQPAQPGNAPFNVSPPVLWKQVTPKYTKEARKARLEGDCLVSLIVDEKGVPKDLEIKHSLGMGLDEKALEAIRKYRFKPALKDGITPIAVRLSIDINFRILQ